MKENSDVQSSVKSQPENEDQSPAIKHSSVKSQPLVDFLEIIRSHRLGSIFERRLESQETEKYTSLIRQHMDLETVRTRLEEGWYSECNSKFFRDLLLLFNNAMVFFGPKSSESMAAAELRQLVLKEVTSRTPPKPSPQERNIPAPPALSTKPDTEPYDSLLVKQKISGPIIACRKRSSLAAKSSVPSPSSSAAAERKKEQTATLMTEEKPLLNWKQQDKKVPKSSTIDDAEEQQKQQHRSTTKKRTRERFTPTTRNSTKSSKSRTNNKNSNANSNENSDPKLEKKNNNNSASSGGSNAKKRGVVNFLSRIKRSPTPNNGSLLETLKSSGISSENSRGGGEQKRNGSRSESARKENQASSRKGGSSGKQAKEQRSPAKRSVGRPPKRAAAPPPSVPPLVSGKRSREAAETEVAGSKQAKKRPRK